MVVSESQWGQTPVRRYLTSSLHIIRSRLIFFGHSDPAKINTVSFVWFSIGLLCYLRWNTTPTQDQDALFGTFVLTPHHALSRFASDKSTLVRSTSSRRALLNVAPFNLAPSRCAPVSSAPVRSAPSRLTFVRSAPLKSAPVRSHLAHSFLPFLTAPNCVESYACTADMPTMPIKLVATNVI